ncbi:hypothetical protein [Tabrizicola caldifontis]|uniref:hypothetical protein n=1 Tax=Tabrizicola caldifontis TaxID=2528036 RepID=UPI001080F62D|nr:hypothetical protein [Rhodobacter sp. YIM 73028]
MNLARTLTLAFLLIFGSAQAILAREPTQADLRPNVQAVIDKILFHYDVENFNFKNFPGESGTGRTSIEGVAILREDLYARDINAGWMRQRLLSAGVPSSEIRTNERVFEFVVKRKKNERINFSFDLEYREAVSGFAFSVNNLTSYRVTEKPLRDLFGEFYIAGSPEAERYFQERLAPFQKKTALLDSVSAYFSGAKLYGFQQGYDEKKRAPVL